MTDDEGKSRCFGFVCFLSVQEASNALAEMNNQLVDGQHLYVALAQPKAVRQAQLERDRMARLSLNMGVGMGIPGMQPGPFPPGMAGMASGLGGMPQMWGPSMGGPQMGGMQPNRGRGGRGPGRFGGRYQGRGPFPSRQRWNGRGGSGGGSMGSFGRFGVCIMIDGNYPLGCFWIPLFHIRPHW